MSIPLLQNNTDNIKYFLPYYFKQLCAKLNVKSISSMGPAQVNIEEIDGYLRKDM